MWRLREGAHPVLTDEGGAILNEHTGRWTYLTPTGTAAVLALLAATDVDQAAAQYATVYSLPRERATADVRGVADSLTAQGLVHVEPSRRRRGWRR